MMSVLPMHPNWTGDDYAKSVNSSEVSVEPQHTTNISGQGQCYPQLTG
jgi:hypothetical protein